MLSVLINIFNKFRLRCSKVFLSFSEKTSETSYLLFLKSAYKEIIFRSYKTTWQKVSGRHYINIKPLSLSSRKPIVKVVMAKVGASTPEFPLTSWFYNGYFIARTGNVITVTVNKYWKSYKASESSMIAPTLSLP